MVSGCAIRRVDSYIYRSEQTLPNGMSVLETTR
jgi:hypothetical protein